MSTKQNTANPTIMKISMSILLVFLQIACLLGQEEGSTSDDNSPTAIARDFSATYGVRADAVEAILRIYEAEGYDAERRKSATEQILLEYAQSPEKQQEADELSTATRRKMGIADVTEVASALEWDLFASSHYLYTTGYNSPTMMDKGDVNIWYGIPPKALRALAEAVHALAEGLESSQIDLSNFEPQLAEQVKIYKELSTELETYGRQEAAYGQAAALLIEGKLEEAEQLIASDFEASAKQQAYKGYIYGKTKELLLKYQEAAKGYKHAVNTDGKNSTYHLYYANNENTLARYDEAIRHYEIALGIDTVSNGNEERIATLFNDLGEVWHSKGAYDKAIGYYERALPSGLKALGDQHPDVAVRYNNLGLAWHSKEAYGKAIGYYEKCQAIWELFFQPTHPYQQNTAQLLAMAANGEGTELFNNKQYQEALVYFQKALENAQKAQEVTLALYSIRNIGAAQQQLQQYEKGLEELNMGLELAAQLHQEVDRAVQEQLTSEQRNDPEIQAEIAVMKNMETVRLMRYHKVSCLKGLGRDKEADALAEQLWQEAVEADDTPLLEDLRGQGYDFGG